MHPYVYQCGQPAIFQATREMEREENTRPCIHMPGQTGVMLEMSIVSSPHITWKNIYKVLNDARTISTMPSCIYFSLSKYHQKLASFSRAAVNLSITQTTQLV